MRFGTLIWVLFGVAALFSVTIAKKEKKEEPVMVLTTKNFDKVIKANELVLVKFYAPWCGHCKKLAPEYEKAAEIMAPKGVILAKVDATVETDLGRRFEINGYPKLKVFRSGQVSDYPGERSADAIVQYMTKQLEPAVSILATPEELEAFIPDEDSEEGPVVVAFTNPESELATFFTEFAKQNRDDWRFGIASTAELRELKGIKLGKIVLYKPYDDMQNEYEGKQKKQELLKFLTKNTFPLVGEISNTNYKKYMDRGYPIAWLFTGDDVEENKKIQNSLREIAADYKEKISFVYINGTAYKPHAQGMALSGNKFPALAIETKDELHYAYPEDKELTLEPLKQFVADFSSKKLEPSYKSEPIPDPPVDENNVRIVVRDNFEEVVLDKSKDVLLEMYAPWCGHCKQLAPIYGQLATELKDVDGVVIAKCDATANDLAANFKPSGFPTIKLITAKTNKIIDFPSDKRTREGFIEFLEKNCVNKIKLPKTGGSDDDDEKDEL